MGDAKRIVFKARPPHCCTHVAQGNRGTPQSPQQQSERLITKCKANTVRCAQGFFENPSWLRRVVVNNSLLPDRGAIHISRRDCVRRSPSRRKNRIYHAGVPSFPALRRAVHREEVRPTSAYENVRKLPRQAPTIGDVLYWHRSIDSPSRTPLDSQRETGRTRLNTSQFNGISRAGKSI